MVNFDGYSVPSQASPGDTVNIVVFLLSDIAQYVGLAVYIPDKLVVNPDFDLADPNLHSAFSTSFVMPNQDVTVELRAYSWDGVDWILENTKSFVILTIAPAPLPSTFSNLGATF